MNFTDIFDNIYLEEEKDIKEEEEKSKGREKEKKEINQEMKRQIKESIQKILIEDLQEYKRQTKEEENKLKTIKESIVEEKFKIQCERYELKKEKEEIEKKQKIYKNTTKRKLQDKIDKLIEENKRLKLKVVVVANSSFSISSSNSSSSSSNNNNSSMFYKETCNQLLDIINDRMNLHPTDHEKSICESYDTKKITDVIALKLYYCKNKCLNLLSKEQLETIDSKYINLPPHNKFIDFTEQK